ncbi:MAG: aldehyde dehydrogenase family protein, partial [Proteobacteria bacterium]|nr:aldehyde dehydrogenase family protein [Pseudomonadota bacterium]
TRHVFSLPTTTQFTLGTFIAPTLLEITALTELTHEVFGPVLHVLRYRRDRLPQLLDDINALGYGLTLGIHSRIDETIHTITTRVHVGNIYVNRNIIGAVVGVQAFGGEGKSGTGPKAGGPLYLKRLQRHPTIHLTEATPARVLPALTDFLQWAKKQTYPHLLRLIELYQQETLFGRVLPCLGPTGESNTLCFTGRGMIACIAEQEDVLLNQLAAVLATGNHALIDTHWTALINTLPTSVQDCIQQHENIATAEQPVTLALVQSNVFHVLRPLFAARDGALIPVIATNSEEVIASWRLLAERALCINTTATGGNASLMTLEDKNES